ncbi:MAG TPA: hypothetical protein VIK11_13830 [Tepidiformaceae bacterium]
MKRISRRSALLAAVLALVVALPAVTVSAADSGSNAPTFTRGAHTSLPYQRVLPSLLPNSRENTTAVAQNAGTAAATIAMDIYTPGGLYVSSASVTYANVPVGGSRTFPQASNTGLTAGFRGVGVISSDQPISAVLVREIASNTDGKSYSIHDAYAAGANTISLPYIANALNGTYNTRMAIANTGTAVACVTVAYAFVPGNGAIPASGSAPYTDNGTGGSGCSSGYPIAVGGQLTLSPDGVDSSTLMPAQTRNALMAATVTSIGSPVTVAVDAYLSDGTKKLASYDGFVVGGAAQEIGTQLSIPLALKTPDGYYSQILLSNPNSTAANATIVYTDGTSHQSYTVALTVPANGTANHSVYSDNVVPTGFVGAATVTSTQPLAAVVFRSKMTNGGSFVDEDLYTAANGVPVGRGATTARFPLIVRRLGMSGSYYGQNTWVSVSPANGGSATLTITSVADSATVPGTCSSAATYTTTVTISSPTIFYQNLDLNNGFGTAPTCFYGSMTITSSAPIIAVADSTNDLYNGDLDGMYNALTP